MNRLLASFMDTFRTDEPLSKMLKRQLLGLTYLFLHPQQIKRIVIRETRYGRRYQNKQSWLEWQEYDQYEQNVMHNSADAQSRPINIARIQTISDIVRGLGNGLNVLDVGCGLGIISEQISNLGNNVTCADLPTTTSLAHKRRVLSVLAADAEHLAFAPNSFDLVLASEVIEHLWDPQVFFEEAYRILKPTGHLMIAVPEGREGLRWDAHIHDFTVESLKQMLSPKFVLSDAKRLKPIKGAPVPTIILLLHKSTTETNS
jgi:2-polyprenyl-3-methyl-5-hydroxy-6-metoxy-1,4-benzoquinol methylase